MQVSLDGDVYFCRFNIIFLCRNSTRFYALGTFFSQMCVCGGSRLGTRTATVVLK